MKRTSDGAASAAKLATAECVICDNPVSKSDVAIDRMPQHVCATCMESQHVLVCALVDDAGTEWHRSTGSEVYTLNKWNQIVAFRGHKSMSTRHSIEVKALHPRHNYHCHIACCSLETAKALRERRKTYTTYDPDERWCHVAITRKSHTRNWCFPASYMAKELALCEDAVEYERHEEYFGAIPDDSILKKTVEHLESVDPIDFRVGGMDILDDDLHSTNHWWP